MTTEHGRSVLAEFMGYDYSFKPGGFHSLIPEWTPQDCEKSYDKLMPVWVKFRELEFTEWNGQYMKHCNKIRSVITSRPISDAFTALVEAVEWWSGVKEKEGV